MRKALVSLTLLGSLLIAAPARAAQPTVFDTSASPLTCTVQNAGPVAGQRWCGTPATTSANPPAQNAPSTVPSFDGTPIDVSVVLPPEPATGTDGDFPLIGVFHGYGGQKYNPSDATYIQRWVSRGYAVMTPTTRGFWGSCGVKIPNPKPPACANGYIHLLANGVEVRDMQYLFGLLADEGVTSATRIGVVGQSYGGGMSLQLGALKNRVSDENGTLTAWKSPGGKDMSIAAAAPEFGWSNLAYGLIPNGSFYDYAALNPYKGPAGDRRAGAVKKGWTDRLYGGGLQTGFYSNADERYDVPDIYAALQTGGPYDNNTEIQDAITQLSSNHSAYGIDDSQAPAPMLLSQGWNDDLFPVSEALRYYNKTRELFPSAALNLFAFDYGHTPRAAINTDNATSLFATQGAWMDHYVRGIGSEPDDAAGGVNLIASGCADGTSGAAPTSSAILHEETWADVAQGELAVTGNAAVSIPSATNTAEGFQAFGPSPPATTICTTSGTANTPGAAVYELPAQSADFMLAGAATVLADVTTSNANDQLVARLYDVDVSAGTQRLIARSVYRPIGTGERETVFQLSPQLWNVVAGHQLKLELLTTDQPYVLNATGQGAVQVENLTLRIPTRQGPGGAITAPAAKTLPNGYTLARDFVAATPTPTPTPSSTPTATPTPTPTYQVPTPTPTPTVYPLPTRKRPGLKVKVRPKNDKKSPFKFTAKGRVIVPRSIGNREGCRSGQVRLTLRRKGSGKPLSTTRKKIKKNCKFTVKTSFKAKRLKKSQRKKGKLKAKVRFQGNALLKAKRVVKQVSYGR